MPKINGDGAVGQAVKKKSASYAERREVGKASTTEDKSK